MNLDGLVRTAEAAAAEVARGPVVPQATAAEIRAYLASRYDFSKPRPLRELIDDVAGMLERWIVHVTHPRYFGLFNPSVTIPGIVADALTALYNPQLASWSHAPAAVEMERHALRWLAARFGLPDPSVAHFTSGGAEANLTAVLAALARAFPGWGERGARGLEREPILYVSSESHHSFDKIATMTGLGRAAVRRVATDGDGRLDPAALARAIEEDRRAGRAPFLAVGTAGTTSSGVIDPLTDVGDVCSKRGVWFHVDAAWGGAAVASPRLRPHLAGVERANSITCDAHKWFSVPMGAGMFFCRDAEAVREAFRVDTPYMPARPADADNPFETTVQWSRRFIGLKLFMTLAERGEDGIAAMIDHQARIGDVLRERLKAAGWTIANRTPLPLVCFTRAGLDVPRFLAELLRRQIAWMSEVRVAGGPPVVRACITSYRTTEADIGFVVREMGRIVGG